VFVHATHRGQALESKVTPLVDKAYAELRSSVDAKSWGALINGLEQISSVDDKTGGV
jgi:hypothetical protein